MAAGRCNYSSGKAAGKPPASDCRGGSGATAEEIVLLAQGMKHLAASLHEFAAYLRENPEISELPACMRELSKRIAVLSTRL